MSLFVLDVDLKQMKTQKEEKDFQHQEQQVNITHILINADIYHYFQVLSFNWNKHGSVNNTLFQDMRAVIRLYTSKKLQTQGLLQPTVLVCCCLASLYIF